MRLITTLALACLAPASLASDLDLRIESSGQGSIVATPGQVISFDLIGQLSDANNEGLAGFAVDIFFSGGPLSPLATPTTAPMSSFASPAGFTNPAGFGGTASNGTLLQIGGGQNTFLNSFAPTPNGIVATGVAKGADQILGSGSLTAPTQPGTYSVNISSAAATAIAAGETGLPFWKVETAPVGDTDALIVTIPGALTAAANSVSVLTGGSVDLNLDAGSGNANRAYFLIGSITGVAPPVQIGSTFLPLVLDSYSTFTLMNRNTAPLLNNFNTLDVNGQATATLVVAPNTYPMLIGVPVHHAYVLVSPTVDFASNAETIVLAP